MAESPLTSPALWNALHEHYERTIVPLFSKVARHGNELLAPDARARFIDVACGPDTLTLNVAPRVHQVVAVDFARRVSDAQWPRVEARILSALTAEFPTGVHCERSAWVAVARKPRATGCLL
jgi:hypothetical protein